MPMLRELTFEKAQEMLAEWLGVDESDVKPTSRIVEDLGADSLDSINLIMAIEEEYGIDIDDDEIGLRVNTVQDAMNYVNEKLKVKS